MDDLVVGLEFNGPINNIQVMPSLSVYIKKKKKKKKNTFPRQA